MAECKVDLAGNTVGRWVVLERTKPGWWLCECSCEEKTRKEIRQQDLQRGKSKSCGCLRRELVAAKNTTHGLSKTKEWRDHIRREWNKANAEHVKVRRKNYNARDYVKAKVKARNKRYSADPLNKEKIRASKRTYRAANRENVAALGAARRAAKKRAIPKWGKELTKKVFKDLKSEAIRLEKETGIKYHVDHIVPLVGMIDGEHVVCGLHVYDNLQLLTAEKNCSKGPRHWPNMPDIML